MPVLAAIDWDDAFAGRAEKIRASEIRELLKLLDQPGIISFAGGIPEPSLFPTDLVARAYAEILGDSRGPQSLQYSVSEGYAPLRSWLADSMGRVGVPCGIDNILITSGSQQALDFLGKLLISAGDTAFVAAPTYLGALQAFNAYEPRYEILDPAETGPAAETYHEAVSSAGSRPALAYVVPDFANPTGESLDEGARRRLLDLATELDVPLIEDAAYTSLRFEGEPTRPCLALDVERCGDIDRSRVVYCGTFSKTISPGLRVGWICAAKELIQKLVLAKQAGDLHSATLNQMVIHRVAEAVFDEQVVRARTLYAGRRDAMLAALARWMPEGTSWTRPDGGMFVWVTLPEGFDGADLLAAAIAEERVAFVPGGAFFTDGSGRNTIRLSYSLQPEAMIEEGIRRLGHVVARLAPQREVATSTGDA